MRIPFVPWISFILCCWYWIHLSVEISVVYGQCLENQQLLQLKSDLKFKHDKSSKLVSWNESIECCQWIGVSCDEKGHVTCLDLSGESIYGGFDNSSSLFNLQHLQVLNLSSNNFSSVIPSGFNKLKNLNYLNLSYAGFVGQIPIEISHLTRLVSLHISSLSYLNGQPLKLESLDFWNFVQSLTKIRQLYLDGVSIAAKGQAWCSALLQLPNLQELSMSNCNLSGPLDSSLTKLKTLSVIRLDQNNLSSSVPESFANFLNLTTLSLSYCRLSGRFPEKIFQVATLSVIDISFNKDLYGFLPEFPLHGHLQTLIVSNTGFSGQLPASVSNLRQLSILDLSECQFNRTLPSSMARLRELTYLDLSYNNFIGPIPSLNMSKNLTLLDASHNYLTGPITSIQLDGLNKLVLIDLQDNFLNGSIPSSLTALPLLKSIRLANNHFGGQLKFLNIISSKLDTLDLSSNNLEGPFPASIFQLKSVNVLKLSSNKLRGTIKIDMFQRLENLTTLDLSYNNLSIDANVTDLGLSSFPKMLSVKLACCNLTKFPSFLRSQSRLFSLDLSSNHIQGSIPTWIWKLGSLVQLNISHNLLTKIESPGQNASANLSVLDLHSNQLQGKLPKFPGHFTYLDYSSNNFSSTIPSDFGTYLSSTIFLSLSKNSLSGSIPQSLCNNSNLLVLDVSYNNLKGTIPECLTQRETLVVLNLHQNMLHGNIPDTFLKSCALSTLDLNGNQLEGPIPKSLANCKTLEVLDLGNNKINDVFPCFIKKLPAIRVMVLRNNKFHGHIGCPKTNGTWHMLQIVDLAFNHFSGLLPRECFKTWEAMMLNEDPNALNFSRSLVLQFGHIYYQDSVTLAIKGLQMEFVKILTTITSIDFSSNNLTGSIPEELMNFTGLYVLNLSHNALTGQIPSSIGNLKQLESLDLSSNNFDGEIPMQLASLSFLSYLNLSFNLLTGKIPVGTQLQSFEATSFAGNKGLYGPPLTVKCTTDKSNSTEDMPTDSRAKFDWTYISTGVGFGVGAGLVVAPIMFWDRGRKWSNHSIDKILLVILPMVGLTYTPIDDEEADTEEKSSDMEEECDYSEEQDHLDYRWFRGWYCVSCSKLDISKKKVIHNPRCACFHSPTISLSTLLESYSS